MNRNSRMFTVSLALSLAMCLALAAMPALATAEGVVNINTADPDTLSLLPRIGPTVAQRIVEFREDNGGFKSTEELMLVKGIGERTYELIRPYVVVEGQTTLTEKVSARQSSTAGSDDT